VPSNETRFSARKDTRSTRRSAPGATLCWLQSSRPRVDGAAPAAPLPAPPYDDRFDRGRVVHIHELHELLDHVAVDSRGHGTLGQRRGEPGPVDLPRFPLVDRADVLKTNGRQ